MFDTETLEELGLRVRHDIEPFENLKALSPPAEARIEDLDEVPALSPLLEEPLKVSPPAKKKVIIEVVVPPPKYPCPYIGPVKKVAAKATIESLHKYLSPMAFFTGTKKPISDTLAHSEGFIDKDGNCLFKAASYLIFKTPFLHTAVRSRAVRHLKDNCTPEDEMLILWDYGKSAEEYIAYMSKLGSWGDQYMLLHICLAFNIKIAVVSVTDGGLGLTLFPKQSTSPPYLGLCHVTRSHYELLVAL